MTRDEIRRNEYNLNIPRYVDSNEPPTKYDIYSTMFGGIPNNEIADLGKYWGAFPTLQQQIFAPEHDRPYSTIKVADIINTIHNNADVIDYKNRFTAAFADLSRLLHIRLVDNVDTVKDVVIENGVKAIGPYVFNKLITHSLDEKGSISRHLENITSTLLIRLPTTSLLNVPKFGSSIKLMFFDIINFPFIIYGYLYLIHVICFL